LATFDKSLKTLTVAIVVNLVRSHVYHNVSVHLCLQHNCRDAARRTGLSVTADITVNQDLDVDDISVLLLLFGTEIV